MAARLFQHAISADNIRLNEGTRSVDGAIDVRLGSQVHHRIRLVPFEDGFERHRITDIHTLKGVPGMSLNFFQGAQITGVGQAVNIDGRMICL